MHGLMLSHCRRFLLGTSVLLLAATAAHGTVRFVKTTAAGNESGSSWGNASDDLQAMIDASVNPNDQVWVAAGTYKPTVATEIGLSRTKAFKLQDAVKMYGGFDPDNGDDQFEERNPFTHLTILSGDLDNDDSSGPPTGDNALHVIYSPGTLTQATVLNGFVICNGLADIYPTIDTQDPYYGVDNTDRGGGLLVDHSCPTLVMCKFINNYGIKGGGLGVDGSISQFAGPGAMLIYNTTFDENTSVDGGAVFCNESSQVQGYAADLHFLNCLIVNNDATARGGAMYLGDYGSGRLFNCTVSQNTAYEFAGIFRYFDPLLDCTAKLGGEASLLNTIVWDNGSGLFDDQTYGKVTLDHCCVEDLDTGSDCVELLDDTGETIGDDPGDNPDFVNPGSGDFRLSNTSPCIDTGLSRDSNNTPYGISAEIAEDAFDVDQDSDTTEETPDLDIARRVYNCAADMGAYEYNSSCEADLTHDGVIDVDDIFAVINNWGACPTAPSFCPGDITPYGANCLTGLTPAPSVDIDDLFEVINHWGTCIFFTGETEMSSYPPELEDCMEEASNYYDAFTPDWNEYVNNCYYNTFVMQYLNEQ